jgi:hypothetical protein
VDFLRFTAEKTDEGLFKYNPISFEKRNRVVPERKI